MRTSPWCRSGFVGGWRLGIGFVWLAGIFHGAALGEPTPAAPFQAAADYLQARNGHALLIFRGNDLIFESYFNGWTAARGHRLASGTKSFCGALAVAAQRDGLLTLDEKVADTLTEWRDDPSKSRVTIRQLLGLVSGIEGGDNGSVPSYTEAVKMANARFEPGIRFQYGPIPFQCFGELLRRKLEPRGDSVEAYLKREILDPIGLKPSFWRKDEDGNINLPAGAFITAREWAKYGHFIRNVGQVGERAVLPEKAFRECFTGSRANPAYGLTFWLGRDAAGPRDLVMAAGKGKQKLYVVPSVDLLVVQLAEVKGRYQEDAFMQLILKDWKRAAELPAITGTPAGTASSTSIPPATPPWFARFDKNNDGKLTPDEAPNALLFRRADLDGDGVVTAEEAMRVRGR